MPIKALLPSDLANEITDLGANDYLVAQKSGESKLSKLKPGAISPADIGAAAAGGSGSQDFAAKILSTVKIAFSDQGNNDSIAMSWTENMAFTIDGSDVIHINGYSVYGGGADGSKSCGKSDSRWSDVYSKNSANNTSDCRLKTDIVDSDLGLDFIVALRPIAYRWIVGDYLVAKDENGQSMLTPRPGIRQHYGLIAQEVKAVLGDKDFGGYLYDPLSDQYGLRYGEFIAPLIKAIQELAAEVISLKGKLEASGF